MKIFKAAKSILSPFLEGIARNLDFAGSIRNSPGHPANDSDALTGDWQMVGSDYNISLKIINEELHVTQKKSEN